MDLEAKKQYMETLREKYLKANKKSKTAILNEYCERAGENRKYAIKGFNYRVKKKRSEERKRRRQIYNGEVVSTFWSKCGKYLTVLADKDCNLFSKPKWTS